MIFYWYTLIANCVTILYIKCILIINNYGFSLGYQKLKLI